MLGDRLGASPVPGGRWAPADQRRAGRRGRLRGTYVREWQRQAASGYVTYTGGRYALDEEQAAAFTDENSPTCIIGGFQASLAATRAVDRLTAAFRTGEGLGWHEHHDDLFAGTERFFRPGYLANLTTSWIPALDGVEGKLRRGARVAEAAVLPVGVRRREFRDSGLTAAMSELHQSGVSTSS